MAMGSTQPLTEMSTTNLPGGEGRLARGADLIAICEPIIQKMWEPRRLTNLWAFTLSSEHFRFDLINWNGRSVYYSFRKLGPQ
jgi:hypothetical protein